MQNENEESTALCNRLLEATMDALTPGALKLLLGVAIRSKIRRTQTTYVLQRLVAGDVPMNK